MFHGSFTIRSSYDAVTIRNQYHLSLEYKRTGPTFHCNVRRPLFFKIKKLFTLVLVPIKNKSRSNFWTDAVFHLKNGQQSSHEFFLNKRMLDKNIKLIEINFNCSFLHYKYVGNTTFLKIKKRSSKKNIYV